jgi:class 3 adenylate cyclase
VGIETVTVMFTDLVDSTALLSRLGEERGDEMRREHFGLLRGVVESVGGREVKNLGDGLMVVFSSTTDAVAAAVAVQQVFARRNRRVNGDALLVRVGVSCGDADAEDGDYFGVPVVEAARLCETAVGGEVLVTELVRLLVGSRGGHTFTSMGGLALKGLDVPVAAHRVEWEAADAGPAPPPLPPRLVAAQAGIFVGRVSEYECLDRAWKAVDGGADGEIGIMLVSGEPGVGKTTLSARFAADVHDQGAVVVYGRCDEDLGIPYRPWVEALSLLVAWLPDEVLAAHVADRGGSIARLVPGLAQRLGSGVPEAGDGDADAQRFVLFACVADLMARASDECAVLVVLDDLHWADQATLQLLRHLATSRSSMQVGVLGTFRDSDIGPSHPLADALAALHRDGRVERIPLQGFGDAELLALLEGIAGHEMTADGMALRDAVLAETSGNPFFAVEVLRHLAEIGAIFQGGDGRWTSTVDVQAAGLPISVK